MLRDDELHAVLVELPRTEWELLARLADADDRPVSQMASRLLKRALRREAEQPEQTAEQQEAVRC